MTQSVVTETNLTNVPLFNRGKVRDLYDLDDKLLMISTDRISAFDYVLPDGIPSKGNVLTALSEFWFNHTNSIVENHLITTDVAAYPGVLKPHADVIKGKVDAGAQSR